MSQFCKGVWKHLGLRWFFFLKAKLESGVSRLIIGYEWVLCFLERIYERPLLYVPSIGPH